MFPPPFLFKSVMFLMDLECYAIVSIIYELQIQVGFKYTIKNSLVSV